MKDQYDDIINLPHHVSKTRPQMSMVDRAAQFSPFAALTGFDGVVAETARLTEERPEMSEEQKAAINDALMELLSRIRERPEAEIVYFRPDARKAGGECVTKRGNVRRIDEANREMLFADGEKVQLESIVNATICS